MTTNKVCGQGKCPFTDEFCMSGDCPYDIDNVTNNVAQRNSQDSDHIVETTEKVTVEKEVYEAVLRNTLRVNELEEENAKLKELLKECVEVLNDAQRNYGYDDSIIDICSPIITKIDEVLK